MLLSVCIATRNRAAVIGETLESVLAGLPANVEIVVLDGASTDDTERVMRSYTERHAQIRYVRLTQNGGVDLDYHRAVQHARGEFCWLMTDDDLVVPGGVETIVRQLTHDVDLVIVNSQVCDGTISQVLEERRLDIARDYRFKPEEFEAFFRLCAYYMSFIGSVVVRRSVWLERDEQPYLGTEFIHCGIIFQRALERDIVVLERPIVQIRYGVAQWSSRAFQIWMFKWPQLIWSFTSIADDAKRAVFPRYPWHELHRLLYYKARGQYSPDVYSSLLATQKFPPGGRAAARAIAHLPDRLWCNAFALAAAVLLPHQRMLQVDLRSSPHYSAQLTTMIGKIAAISGRALPT
jgi:glycosyltransferase involved in cell wall biosynthesis